MKCAVLKLARPAHMPIAQLNGVVLHMTEKLLVRADLAPAVLKSAPWLKQTGEAEVEKLGRGVFDVLLDDGKGEEPAKPAGVSEPASPAPDLQAGDRSMAGVGRGKRKTKKD